MIAPAPRRAWHVGEEHLLAAPGEFRADGLEGFLVVMSLAANQLVVRAVGCLLQGRHGCADLGIVGSQAFVALDRLLDLVETVFRLAARTVQQERETDDALQHVLRCQALADRALALAAGSCQGLVAPFADLLADSFDHSLLLSGEVVPKEVVEVIPKPGTIVFFKPVASPAVGARWNDDDLGPRSRLALSAGVPFAFAGSRGLLHGRTDYRLAAPPAGTGCLFEGLKGPDAPGGYPNHEVNALPGRTVQLAQSVRGTWSPLLE